MNSRENASASLFSDAPNNARTGKLASVSAQVFMTQVFVAVLSQLTFDREQKKKITGNEIGVRNFAMFKI